MKLDGVYALRAENAVVRELAHSLRAVAGDVREEAQATAQRSRQLRANAVAIRQRRRPAGKLGARPGPRAGVVMAATVVTGDATQVL